MTKKHIRVMVVEDSEATAYLIKKAFSDRGEKVDWDICFAKDGQEALDCVFRKGRYAEAALPEFVLLDWNLPKVSGKEVLRLLKSDENLRTLPVLVDRFSHFVTILRRTSVYFQVKGLAVLA